MKLSVMFITHNRKDELIRAINSCIDNAIEDMEFVIVDNNSNDGTMKAVKDLLGNYKFKLNYFFSNKNLGVAGGRNKAFSMCKGEYIFCLDDDAIINANQFLKRTCEYMDKNQDVAVMAYNIYEPSTGKYLISHLDKSNKQSFKYKSSLSFMGGAHTLRKEVFKSKLYPEKLFFGAEELYASHIAWNKGYKIKYIHDMDINHLPSKINATRGKVRDYNFILNQYIVRLLTYPYLLWPILTLLFIMRLIKNRLFSIKYMMSIIKDMKIRYIKSERKSISYKTIILLIRKFGIKNIF